MTQRLLNITLEIIYLLTGEDYTVVKSRKRAKIRELGELDRSQAPPTITTPPPSHNNENNDRRILELAYKIIQLLNGEEGDYVEGHHDFYADMLDNEQSFRLHDLSGHGLVIYTSDNKEEPMLCEEETFMDNAIYTSGAHHSYILTQDDKSISQEEGKLTDTDITYTVIKKEPPSYDEENPVTKDVWPLTDHMQQASSSHVKEEDTLYVKSTSVNDLAPIGHRQEDSSTDVKEHSSDQLFLKQSTPIKNELISYKDTMSTVEISDKVYMERRKAHAKENVHDPQGKNEYTIVQIKNDSSSEEDNIYTEELLQDDIDIQEDNNVSANLSQQDGTINNVTVNIYRCVGCQKHFTTKTDLKTHQTIYKTFQKSICPECGKTFLCTSALIIHRQSHTREKPFSCTVCGKSFGQLSQLKTHERIHSDERPFSCSVCGKCFRCRSHLISHARIHKEDIVSIV